MVSVNVLLSQGMTRPGIVQGQHWGEPLRIRRPSVLGEPPYAPVWEWLDPSLRPTPARRPDPRLSNPELR